MKQPEKLLLIILIVLGSVSLFIANIFSQFSAPQENQQFVDLANSFLNGQLSFLPSARSIYDSSLVNNRFYWPLGPLPGVMLMPFVFFAGPYMMQGYLQFILIGVIFYLLYKIAQSILKRRQDALWLSFGYIFSTAFIGVALQPYSWQFAQVVATLFVLAALKEYVYKKRWFSIGFYLALAIAARLDLILAVVFFAGSIIFQNRHARHKISQAVLLCVPLGISVALLLAYNYFRFNNIFDPGYASQHLTDTFLIANRNEAVWGLIHFPANLYYFFFKGPDGVFLPGTQILTYPYLRENDWGMSIFLTSPLFLWIVKAPFRKKEVILAGSTVILIAFAIFGYYGIGYDQFGYRYALDFYPFLFLMLLFALQKHVPHALKFVIAFSFIFNLYLIVTP
jgi:hypothetical protein